MIDTGYSYETESEYVADPIESDLPADEYCDACNYDECDVH